jgi:putative heme-binding domain-containing protein
LLGDTALRGQALRALATFNDPASPAAILAVYGTLDTVQKRDALNTLVSRPAFAQPLLTAVGENKVSVKDLTADVVRQLRAMKDEGVQQLLTKVYGTFRETTADKKALMEKYRGIYRAGYSQPGEAGRGRVIFNRICAQCHTLYDFGGKIGPDLTGSNRGDLNYLLENILDPNAVIPNEYRFTAVETKDGRTLGGVVKKQDDTALTIATPTETVVVPRNEVKAQTQLEISMMPEGLLTTLNDQEFRDLIYYLTRPGQVPLPAESAAK